MLHSDTPLACFCAALDIRDIQQQIRYLDSITTWSETMKKNSGRILDSAHKVRECLTSQVATLDEKVAGIRKAVSG